MGVHLAFKLQRVRRAAISAACAALAAIAISTLPAAAAPESFCVASERRETCLRPACLPDAAASRPDWHSAAQCMRNLRDVWSAGRNDPRAQAAAADLARRYVEFAITQPAEAATARGGGAPLLVERNDRGEAFNAMGQSGVAYFLLQFSRLAGSQPGKTDADWYRGLAVRAIDALLTPARSGGFLSRTDCGGDSCVWFHSVTRRDWSSSEGGTLNQDLHAIRDLLMIVNGGFGLPTELEERIDTAVAAGLRQLLAGTDPATPTLDGYFPPGSSQPIAYYGARLKPGQGPAYYMLGKDGRDCHYHIHVTDLLFQIATEAAKRPRLAEIAGKSLTCGSSLWRYEAAIEKLRSAPERAACPLADLASYRPFLRACEK